MQRAMEAGGGAEDAVGASAEDSGVAVVGGPWGDQEAEAMEAEGQLFFRLEVL